MRVALLTTFVASRKEPLAEMLQRIYQAFSAAGLDEPVIRFNFGDTQLSSSASAVDRVLKRHPELVRFVTTAVPTPLIPGARRITNDPLSPAAGEAVPFPTLHAIAAGVPRSSCSTISPFTSTARVRELSARRGCRKWWNLG